MNPHPGPASGRAALLDAQERVFTIAQAGAHGIADHHIRSQIRAARWQQVHPRVCVAHSGPLTYEARLWAAVLYAGGGAALCRETAAHAWGLLPSRPGTVHVLIVRSFPLHSARGVTVHRTHDLPRNEVYRSRAPDRTSVERTVIDLLGQAKSPEDVGALIAGAVQTGRTTPARLAAALERWPRLRNRRLARGVLALASDGAQSPLEIQHARLGRRHGLPTPSRQAPRPGPGHSCYLDALYEQYGVAVELDGRLIHTRARRWWADMDRGNRLQTADLITLRFPGFLVLSDPCRVAADIAAALHARGWPTPHRLCPNCPSAPSVGLSM